MSNANGLVENIVELLTRTSGATIEVKSSLSNCLWGTEIDHGQLENTFLNMTINARNVKLNSGSFTIETAYLILGKGYVIQNQDEEPMS
jgi:hypothetical protein|tara:strand:+ start:151 stop:417 length:267 start_codon:yes stop_codon:yes gene_type:complete